MLAVMRGEKDSSSDYGSGAGAAILPNLVERRVCEYRKGDGRRNQPKLILLVMSIRRRHLALSQARQCGPEVINRGVRWLPSTNEERI
jgi:hypothetical protein